MLIPLLKAKRIFLIVSIPNISWCPPKGTFSPRKTVVQGGAFLHAHHALKWVTFTCRSTDELQKLRILKADFHPEWNYGIRANKCQDN
jgi:hypothetical protein